MKKIQLFTFIFLLFATAGYSQFNKGSLLLGADLGFNTQTATGGGAADIKTHGFHISPTLAIAAKQNMFWGASLSIGYSKNTAAPASEQIYHTYDGTLFFRKYKQVAGRLYAFIQPGVMIGFSKYENKNGPDYNSESKGFNAGLNITPGISVNVSKKIYLEAGFSNIAAVYYNQNKTSAYNFGNITNSKTSGFSFSGSLGSFSNNLYFGFRFIIPKNS